MKTQKIEQLLYSVPANVDYTELAEELDREDISNERIQGLLDLLDSNDLYIRFQASKLLTSWGVEDGLNQMINFINNKSVDGLILHRLHGYDDTYKVILDALLSYRASRTDLGYEQNEIRKEIYHPIVSIIKLAEAQPFQIDRLFSVVKYKKLDEYIPHLKEYLKEIIKYPDAQYWNIHDVMELFVELEPDFVMSLLKRNNYKLSDFGL